MLLAVARSMQVESDLIPGIATGFCSGMARTGGQCGAVSGGMLAISLVAGRSSSDQTVDACYAAVRDFMHQFAGQFGSISCPVLTGVDLATPEGQAAFRASHQLDKCADYVGEATRLVMETLNKTGLAQGKHKT